MLCVSDKIYSPKVLHCLKCRSVLGYNLEIMDDNKLTNEEIEALDAQIKSDQDKPIRENERRVRIGENLEDAVKRMSKTPPISNRNLAKWAKKQRDTGQE